MMKHILRDKHIILLSIILLIGFYLRVDGISFGLPLLFNRDEANIIDNAIRIVETGDLNPHFFWYPSFMIYLAAGIYRMLLLLGGLGLLQASGTMLYLATRFSSAVFGTLTILAAYLIGQKLHDENTGIIASLFLAIVPLHVEHSHYATIHVPTTFFIILCLYFCVLIVKHGRKRYYTLAGMSAGLATSTSYVGGLVMVPLFVAFVIDCVFLLKRRNSDSVKTRILKFSLILVLPVLVYLVFTPYTILDYNTFRAQLFDPQSESITSFMRGNPVGWYYYLDTPLKEGIGHKLEILSILGILYALFVFRKEYVVFLSWLISYYAFFSSILAAHDRYMLQIVPVLVLFASIMFWKMIHSLVYISKKYFIGIPSKVLVVFLLLIILAYPWNDYQTTVYRTLWVRNFIFHEKDTRTIAFEWIEENIPAGSKIIRGDHTPDLEFSSKNYSVLSILGRSELIMVASRDYKWLTDNNTEYAVFSDASRGYFGQALIQDFHENISKAIDFYGNISKADVLFDAYFDELNKNAELIKTVDPAGFKQISTLIDLPPGENIFMFHSIGGCDAPSVVGTGEDTRCLSFAFRNMLIGFNTTGAGEYTAKSPVDVLNFGFVGSPKTVVGGFSGRFQGGWYHPETGVWGVWRWISQNATISLYNPLNHTVQAQLVFEVKSFHVDRKLEVFANDRLVGEYNITSERPGPKIWIYKIPSGDNSSYGGS